MDTAKLMSAVALGDVALTRQAVGDLLQTDTPLPKLFLQAIYDALECEDWSKVSAYFGKQAFFAPDGTFLLIGNYTTRREGQESTKLSALYGERLNIAPVPNVETHLMDLFGEIRQVVPTVIPIKMHAAAGGLADDTGSEAFIVPDGWGFPNAEAGPALNNMPEQRRRFLQGGRAAIRAVFERETAELLLAPYKTQEKAFATIQTEYQVHDAGHASGMGIHAKIHHNLLTSPLYRAVEEWRSDGVAFEILSRALPTEQAAMVVASNLNVRFGIDALRSGQLADTDINATMLTLSRLVWSGEMDVSKNGKLTLAEPTPRGLLKAVELMQADAVALTRRELHLSKPEDLWHLFGTIPVDPLAVALFKGLVQHPCSRLKTGLR
jgi:Family of unknown function (DUF6014)